MSGSLFVDVYVYSVYEVSTSYRSGIETRDVQFDSGDPLVGYGDADDGRLQKIQRECREA